MAHVDPEVRLKILILSCKPPTRTPPWLSHLNWCSLTFSRAAFFQLSTAMPLLTSDRPSCCTLFLEYCPLLILTPSQPIHSSICLNNSYAVLRLTIKCSLVRENVFFDLQIRGYSQHIG